MICACRVGLFLILLAPAAHADDRFPLFGCLTENPGASLIAYTPSELDPRNEANQRRLPTSSIRADLQALRPAFDGLVLYGYHEACTPRILAVARDLKYRAVLLAVWDPKSAAELDGVAELARLFEKDFALGVLIGNEGLTFKRYEEEDLTIAAARLRPRLPKSVPISTSEPLAGYERALVREFGEFLAPNIHPVFDRPQLAAADAAAWVHQEAVKLAERTGKPVMVKETGFPHGGREPYTPDSQRAFWEAYSRLDGNSGARNWISHAVAFEAFDLPWKSEESKLVIEQSWGLLSAKRVPSPAFEAWKAIRKP